MLLLARYYLHSCIVYVSLHEQNCKWTLKETEPPLNCFEVKSTEDLWHETYYRSWDRINDSVMAMTYPASDKQNQRVTLVSQISPWTPFGCIDIYPLTVTEIYCQPAQTQVLTLWISKVRTREAHPQKLSHLSLSEQWQYREWQSEKARPHECWFPKICFPPLSPSKNQEIHVIAG